jgi:hypothetical protein
MDFVAFPANRLGVSPCWRAYFLLLRQKKVAKEKATPGSAPATPVPCVTRWSGRLAKLAFGSDNASRLPPAPLRYSAPLMGTPKSVSQLTDSPELKDCGCFGEKDRTNRMPSDYGWFAGVPMRGAEQRRCWRKKGEDCLRAKPEFRSPRQYRVAQGTGEAGADPGVAFFLATFSWRSKKKYARQQGGTPSPLVD